MPQMMPMSWFMLYVLFLTIFIMFNIINFYISITTKENKSTKNNMKMKSLFWKW
uniref:ATP synthase F0 subunit 8 n=1 Tax=Balta valida TaxID=2163922 RepID=UPI0027980A6C|nr:ATP synthase F0 subunit 8 [Balta valida]WGO57109.1 ATP synthase F0 subunit 8 [Balta valida]